MTCDRCKKEFDEKNFVAESFSSLDEYEFDHICYDCADELLTKQKEENLDVTVSNPHYYSEEYHKCYLCGEIYPESELKKEGNGEGDWMCDGCIDECISRGEPLLLHY